MREAYREYQFNTVAQRLYDFFWSDYCDWFIEAAKTDIFQRGRGTKGICSRGHGSVIAFVRFCDYCIRSCRT